MQGMGVQFDAGGPGGLDQAGLIDLQWGKIKSAMEVLLKSFHSVDQRDSEVLEDIFDYFIEKVEFDSPLAGPE